MPAVAALVDYLCARARIMEQDAAIDRYKMRLLASDLEGR